MLGSATNWKTGGKPDQEGVGNYLWPVSENSRMAVVGRFQLYAMARVEGQV
jgi:hypothetical protein